MSSELHRSDISVEHGMNMRQVFGKGQLMIKD
jgi:hypothetical protein